MMVMNLAYHAEWSSQVPGTKWDKQVQIGVSPFFFFVEYKEIVWGKQMSKGKRAWELIYRTEFSKGWRLCEKGSRKFSATMMEGSQHTCEGVVMGMNAWNPIRNSIVNHGASNEK